MCDCDLNQLMMEALERQARDGIPLWALSEMAHRMVDLDEDWETAATAVWRKMGE